MLSITNMKFFVFFLILFCLPPLILTYADVSRSLCIFGVVFLLFLFSLNNLLNIKIERSILIKVFFIFILISLSSFFSLLLESNYKPIFSCLILFLIFNFLLFFSNNLSKFDIFYLARSLFCVFVFCTSIGWVYILFKENLPDFGHEKYIFPFTEHSHYALSVCYIGIVSTYFLSNLKKNFVILTIFIQGLVFPNLTMVFFGFLALILLYLKGRKLMLLIMLIILFFGIQIFTLFLTDEQLGYFTDRMTLDFDTYNLTTLVYLQGIEDAFRAIKDTYGLGLGFQMAGTSDVGRFGEAIRYYNGKDFNREDAGFLGAKLVIEFGVFGVILLIYFLYKFLDFILKSKSDNLYRDFYSISFCCLFIEIFFRGYGYFSSQIIFLILAYVYSSMRMSVK